MTTVAFDGKTLAADTLATDPWGLCLFGPKIFTSNDGLWHCGFAGERALTRKWFEAVKALDFGALLEHGYPSYVKDSDDPSILVVGSNGEMWTHSQGIFLRQDTYPFFALGSGRDFAIAAMSLGADSVAAVECAMRFDNGTGGEITAIQVVR